MSAAIVVTTVTNSLISHNFPNQTNVFWFESWKFYWELSFIWHKELTVTIQTGINLTMCTVYKTSLSEKEDKCIVKITLQETQR